MIQILNLGAGVQSTTVLLMSCRGELPKLDCAIFADTGWEPRAVYDHLLWLEKESERHGIPVHRVTAGVLRRDTIEGVNRANAGHKVRTNLLPVFVDGGRVGITLRQCTGEYKIQPIERFIRREILSLKPRQRAPKEHTIDQWFGISADEVRRMRQSPDKYRVFCYPLVNYPNEYLPKVFTRQDCHIWLKKNYPERDVPRSACIGCPYHSNSEWRKLRDKSPDEFADAVEFDAAIRKCAGMRGGAYIHRDCVPLDEVDLRTAEDLGQGDLWDNECEGMCGL